MTGAVDSNLPYYLTPYVKSPGSLDINYLRYEAEGGQAKVEAGINFGIAFPMWKKL